MSVLLFNQNAFDKKKQKTNSKTTQKIQKVLM